LASSNPTNRLHYDFFELANGLRVFVCPMPDVPKVAFNLLYRVGAADEAPHRTGMAHLFEHLMFGGSKNIPVYDAPLQRAGGENNAFTNSDITNYYITLPADQLETAFWLESDRMLELAFTPKSLEVQRSVVCEEFKQRYLNQPYGDAYLELRPLHFTHHPYNWMTIGKELSHIEDVTLDEVKDFFFNFYAPNNATLSVAGPVSTKQVRTLAEKWFGDIPRRAVQRPARAQEPPHPTARQKTVHRPVPHAAVYRAYSMPARSHKDYYAVDLTTDLLAGGKSGRLYPRLVQDRKLCTRTSAFVWGLYDPGMLSVDAVLADGVAPETYEAALQEVLTDLHDTLTEAELERCKVRIEANEVFQRTTALHIAMSLGYYDSIGNVDLIHTENDRYRAVTRDDIRRVLQTYLAPHQASTLYYLPQQ